MKQKAQQVILVILCVVLSPCALLALLWVFAALSSAASEKDVSEAAMVVPWLLLGISLPVFDVLLLRRISKVGYERRTRRLLFAFYCGVMLYCGIWAASPIRIDDRTYALFSPAQFVAVLVFLAFPAVFTMLAREEQRTNRHSKTG